ncbi:YebC/PmpR family DNA-binding transcriptional regulator, partial [bacterium]|nr:YebC/PmpR family DNA-binding transcriptional regulator [bacterium]
SDIRAIFGKNGGNLGDQGSSAWMFDRVCLIEGTKADIGDPEEEAIEAGANEVYLDNEEESKYSFYGDPADLDEIRNALIARGWDITTAELSYKAKNKADITEEQTADVVKLLELLDDNDDTHRIYSTID